MVGTRAPGGETPFTSVPFVAGLTGPLALCGIFTSPEDASSCDGASCALLRLFLGSCDPAAPCDSMATLPGISSSGLTLPSPPLSAVPPPIADDSTPWSCSCAVADGMLDGDLRLSSFRDFPRSVTPHSQCALLHFSRRWLYRNRSSCSIVAVSLLLERVCEGRWTRIGRRAQRAWVCGRKTVRISRAGVSGKRR